MKCSDLFRWIVIAAFGGCGLKSLAAICGAFLATFQAHHDPVSLFSVVLDGVFAFVCIPVSLFAFLRKDRLVAIVLFGVAALMVFALLLSLPRQIGIWEWLSSRGPGQEEWIMVIGLPVAILSLYGPIYGAAWFFRLFLRATDRSVFRSPSTRALPKGRLR